MGRYGTAPARTVPPPGAPIAPRVPNPRLPLALGAGLLLVGLGTGCVHTYQPLQGLHQPVITDPTVRNFEGVNLTVHCVPGDGLTRQQNLTLCRRVGTLFENQGATVTTIDTAERVSLDDTLDQRSQASATPDQDGAPADDQAPPTELILELRSRELERRNPTLNAVLCSISFTLIPAVEDQTHALDLTVRDEDGFLLVRDTLKWRLIRRFGLGVWAGNQIADWLIRDKDEQRGRDGQRDLSVGRKTAGADFSEDLYGQLTQIVFNAQMRRSVLHEVGPADTSLDPWGRR